MPTFKLALKLIKKNIVMIILNIIIYTFIAILMGSFYNGGSEELIKTKLAIINEDNESAIVDAFKASLNDIADFEEIETDTKSMQDALFYQTVDYILIFPQNYSENFFAGNPVSPEKITLPNSFASVQIENRFNLFVNTAMVYYNAEINSGKNDGEIDKQAILQKTGNDLNQQVEIEIMATWKTRNLYRFRTYCLFGLMTLFSLIGNILLIPMLELKKNKIMKRNLCAPVSSKRINLEILLAVALLFVIAIIFYILIAAAFFGNVVFTVNGLWMCLNVIILGICYLGLCFLLSVLLKSVNAINFAATALSLTFCFAGGAFVPQNLLSQGFLTFGKMTPAYWFVNNIEKAYLNSGISGNLLGSMLGQMGIILGFGLASLMVGLVIQRYKVKR